MSKDTQSLIPAILLVHVLIMLLLYRSATARGRTGRWAWWGLTAPTGLCALVVLAQRPPVPPQQRVAGLAERPVSVMTAFRVIWFGGWAAIIVYGFLTYTEPPKPQPGPSGPATVWVQNPTAETVHVTLHSVPGNLTYDFDVAPAATGSKGVCNGEYKAEFRYSGERNVVHHARQTFNVANDGAMIKLSRVPNGNFPID